MRKLSKGLGRRVIERWVGGLISGRTRVSVAGPNHVLVSGRLQFQVAEEHLEDIEVHGGKLG